MGMQALLLFLGTLEVDNTDKTHVLMEHIFSDRV